MKAREHHTHSIPTTAHNSTATSHALHLPAPSPAHARPRPPSPARTRHGASTPTPHNNTVPVPRAAVAMHTPMHTPCPPRYMHTRGRHLRTHTHACTFVCTCPSSAPSPSAILPRPSLLPAPHTPPSLRGHASFAGDDGPRTRQRRSACGRASCAGLLTPSASNTVQQQQRWTGLPAAHSTPLRHPTSHTSHPRAHTGNRPQPQARCRERPRHHAAALHDCPRPLAQHHLHLDSSSSSSHQQQRDRVMASSSPTSCQTPSPSCTTACPARRTGATSCTPAAPSTRCRSCVPRWAMEEENWFCIQGCSAGGDAARCYFIHFSQLPALCVCCRCTRPPCIKVGGWRSSPSSRGGVWPSSSCCLPCRQAYATPTQHPTCAHTHSWAQLDELVVERLPGQEIEALQQMDASCRERMLLAGVRVLVGGAQWCCLMWEH